VRHQIESNPIPQERKAYHLLDELIEQKRKVVVVDKGLGFIKHRGEYLAVQVEEEEFDERSEEEYIAQVTKYFDKDAKMADVLFSRIRKKWEEREWEGYYQCVDRSLEKIYERCPDKSLIFLNFQVRAHEQLFIFGGIRVEDFFCGWL
jgi:hypothetical protein